MSPTPQEMVAAVRHYHECNGCDLCRDVPRGPPVVAKGNALVRLLRKKAARRPEAL